MNGETGISAATLRREMELGSLQTAWLMLHRYCSVLGRPGRDRLRGEVDEAFLSGPEPGIWGRGALDKVLFVAAIERHEHGFGRARLGVIPDAGMASRAAFLDSNVEPGSRLIIDGWPSYPAATRERYVHTVIPIAGSVMQTYEVLPVVHRVLSLVNHRLVWARCRVQYAPNTRGPTSTSGCSVSPDANPAVAGLFHTLLSYAVAAEPVTYRSIRKAK